MHELSQISSKDFGVICMKYSYSDNIKWLQAFEHWSHGEITNILVPFPCIPPMVYVVRLSVNRWQQRSTLPIWRHYAEEYAHPPFSWQYVTKNAYADTSNCTKMIFTFTIESLCSIRISKLCYNQSYLWNIGHKDRYVGKLVIATGVLIST